MKHLVFDLMKIPFLKRLTSMPRLIVEVLHDQNLQSTENFNTLKYYLSQLAPQFLEVGRVVISLFELDLLNHEGQFGNFSHLHKIFIGRVTLCLFLLPLTTTLQGSKVKLLQVVPLSPTFVKLAKFILFDCFGVRFLPPPQFSKKAKVF